MTEKEFNIYKWRIVVIRDVSLWIWLSPSIFDRWKATDSKIKCELLKFYYPLIVIWLWFFTIYINN